MRIKGIEYGYEHKLVKGFVHDEEKNPIGGAVVILEKIIPKEYETTDLEENKYLAYTMTNFYGEFCFPIEDITSFYKIKIFANQFGCK